MPSVAILGASADRSKFSNKSLRAHAAAGYDVFPVNPRGGQIEGRDVYASLTDLPVPRLDRVSVYLPPAVLLGVLDEIARVGCRELWLNPGTTSSEVIARAKSLGLSPIEGCSIVDLGFSPAEFGD